MPVSKSLRPCLKAASSELVHPSQPPLATPLQPFSTSTSLLSPHVHFPPSPCMISSMHTADSPTSYDRAPIVVSPNSCALPERGGRTYGASSPLSPCPTHPVQSYFDPKASLVTKAQDLRDDEETHDSRRRRSLSSASARIPPPPELTFSECTDSDSDHTFSPPLSAPVPHVAIHDSILDFPPPILPSGRSSDDLQTALAFLPHSPEGDIVARKNSKRRSPAARRTPPRTVPSFRTTAENSDSCLSGF